VINYFGSTLKPKTKTMASIQLNFINQSQDTGNSTVVIFQKNEAAPDTAVAWRVIERCSPGKSYPFTFSADLAIAASDSYGNYTPQLPATTGQQYTVQQSAGGDRLVATGAASAAENIELLNGLTLGAINASIYRDGKLLATFTGIPPGQKAQFLFGSDIWIGVVPSQVQEGQVLDAAILQTVNTHLSLLGIQKANIIMSGDGAGTQATPFVFTLENVEYA
jgi:hypothetical protein